MRQADPEGQALADRSRSQNPVTVGFAVTECGSSTSAGDYFTALELAEACHRVSGWETKFLPLHPVSRFLQRPGWYDATDIDLLIVMRDDFDLRELRNASPTLITVAWMRNWFDRWLRRPWFLDYDIYLCSSKKALAFVEDSAPVRGHLFPIATNADRFAPGSARPELKSDYCFSGHWHGAPRDIQQMLQPDQIPWEFALYGRNWDRFPQFARWHRGPMPYERLPEVYASTRIVIDDAVNGITKPWASVNSRVFDALAAGALVVTSGTEGAHELFADRLPSFASGEELQSHLLHFLGNESARCDRVQELREEVLDNHTYAVRAERLRELVSEFRRDCHRIAIKVPIPRKSEAVRWGDYHFARGLKRALKREGHTVRIDLMPDWYAARCAGDEVVIVLRGLSRYRPAPDQINLMWNISHPDRITDEEYEEYDHVFVASGDHAAALQTRLRVPVEPLLQCTDPELLRTGAVDEGSESLSDRMTDARSRWQRLTLLGKSKFRRTPTPPPREHHQVLFVGNARRPNLSWWRRRLLRPDQYAAHGRRIVSDAIIAGLPLSVFGGNWEGVIPMKYVRGHHVPYGQLAEFYGNCDLLLNDHWPSMREYGFVSNRIFDAGACGACVLSDDLPQLREIFGEAVPTCRTTDELQTVATELLGDPEARAALAGKLESIVLKEHTFSHRVPAILNAISRVQTTRCRSVSHPGK